jgi:hypothetical protein
VRRGSRTAPGRIRKPRMSPGVLMAETGRKTASMPRMPSMPEWLKAPNVRRPFGNARPRRDGGAFHGESHRSGKPPSEREDPPRPKDIHEPWLGNAHGEKEGCPTTTDDGETGASEPSGDRGVSSGSPVRPGHMDGERGTGVPGEPGPHVRDGPVRPALHGHGGSGRASPGSPHGTGHADAHGDGFHIGPRPDAPERCLGNRGHHFSGSSFYNLCKG